MMPRYGQNIEKLLSIRENHLNNASIFGLGLKIVDILELIHESGFVYNDLKPDNVMLGLRDFLPLKIKHL